MTLFDEPRVFSEVLQIQFIDHLSKNPNTSIGIGCIGVGIRLPGFVFYKSLKNTHKNLSSRYAS